ncbi:MAG: hypothetical protein VZR53_12620 [Prevotella sp.]|nr:hypothetical protein [Prevotella sp.]
MSISSLFAGMEAYLDGDINYTDTVDDTAIAEQTAEVASDTADASEEAKDTEVASQMLSRMCDMYAHVKQFGIDRTFVSLYNRHGELDRVCGVQFPSCESMDVVGDRYSRYSTAFIAAMESSGSGLWAKVKEIISKIWNWIKNVASKIWEKIKALFGFRKKRWQKAIDFLKQHKGTIAISAGTVAAITAGVFYVKKMKDSKTLEAAVEQAKETTKSTVEAIRTVSENNASPETQEEVIANAEQNGERLQTLTTQLDNEEKEANDSSKDTDQLSDDNITEHTSESGPKTKPVDPQAKSLFYRAVDSFTHERDKFLFKGDFNLKNISECIKDLTDCTQTLATKYSDTDFTKNNAIYKIVTKNLSRLQKLYSKILSCQAKIDKKGSCIDIALNKTLASSGIRSELSKDYMSKIISTYRADSLAIS